MFYAIQKYRLDVGKYPNKKEGLKVLVKSNNSKWNGPYLLDKKLIDFWDKRYLYTYRNGQIELRSGGQDGQIGTDDDIVFTADRSQNTPVDH